MAHGRKVSLGDIAQLFSRVHSRFVIQKMPALLIGDPIDKGYYIVSYRFTVLCAIALGGAPIAC